ncbi:MAG: SDR family NAD(P)-dependent oxidoreductase, partial [Candidatus Omnitrophica bacterium]|nr:SDR family NAD(P)-dependent oxidoreductase [Candidatus Omnitrophota bacterium]
MKLKDRVAIITGGTKGIGLGCARVFGKHGGKVVIAARDEANGKKIEEELQKSGIDAFFIPCDVSKEEDMVGLIETTVEKYGRLDCMVNNAGWHPPALTIDQISVEDFENLVRLNLTSTFMGCKFSIPHLKKSRGNIINMSSEVANIGQTSAASYVSTKAGQIGMTKALALDLAADGVR